MSSAGEELGSYDWLVSGDRSIAAILIEQQKTDTVNHHLQNLAVNFAQPIQQHFKAIPSLVLMIAFHESLDESINFDSLLLKGGSPQNNKKLQKISWISRDSSKPGRHREDGGDCWVVQSTLEYAQQIIE